MRKAHQIIIATALGAFLLAFFGDAGSMFAQTDLLGAGSSRQAATVTGEQVSAATQQTQAAQPADDSAARRENFIKALRDQLRATQHDFYDVSRNIKDANNRIDDTQATATTLTEQLNNLNSQIDVTGRMVQNVQLQITEKENALALLYEDMDVKKAAIENEKRMLVEYLQALYEQESSISDTLKSNQDINIAKLLLSDVPVGEQLQEIHYFSILEDRGHEIFNTLQQLLLDLQTEETNLETEKNKLAELYDNLAEQQANLEVQKEAKQNLLDQTKGEEQIYQQMLAESKKQQEQALDDINTLSSNLKFIQDKMNELGDQFNPDDFRSLLGKETTSVYEYIKSTKDDQSIFSPSWPVSPSRGISAYYHDASYKRAFGVEHQAIDIRATQGTPIRAPADGVVYKVRDNGFGYSYLILAHQGGFMTVYGHVSEFRVEEGEKVVRGQIVALSGGMPGSKGAGVMTTGAHLHFEVIKGGKHVDPLDYLPLAYLSQDGLPDKYLSRMIGAQAKVSRSSNDEMAASNGSELTQMVETSGALDTFVLNQMAQKAQAQTDGGAATDGSPESTGQPASSP